MKTYSELTSAEQTKAIEKCLNRLLEAVCDGAIRFNDDLNSMHVASEAEGIQARIDKAFYKAERMQTPWFASEYIMEAVGEELLSMATCEAEDALYSLPSENVIDGIASEAINKIA